MFRPFAVRNPGTFSALNSVGSVNVNALLTESQFLKCASTRFETWPLTLMLNPFFFSQNRALNGFSMASGKARPSMLSSYVIGRIRTSYGFDQVTFCQDGLRSVQQLNS